MKNKNGNDKLNESRDSHNDRVDKLANMGNTKTAQWRRKRRNKPI